MYPLVSIIIPVFMTEKYLERCINSAIYQTYKNIEIILVNDGSTDACPLICDIFMGNNSNISTIHQENKGLSEARNTGMKLAKGKYIYFLDSDDYICENAIETLVRIAEERNVDIVLFDANVVDENDKIIENKIGAKYLRKQSYPDVHSGVELLRLMIQNNDYSSSVPLLFLRKEFLQNKEVYFYPKILHEDELFTIQALISAKRAIHTSKRLFNRRLRSGSIMRSDYTHKNVIGYCKVIQEMITFCEDAIELKQYSEITDRIYTMMATALNIYSSLSEEQQENTRSELELVYERIERSKLFMQQKTLINGYIDKYLGAKRVIFYGAGEKCGDLLRMVRKENLKLADIIWDERANTIISVMEIEVIKPDFQCLTDKCEWFMVICIANTRTCSEIIDCCHKYMFYNVCDWREIYIEFYNRLFKSRYPLSIRAV